ncbi:MAG: DUF815 domain-containing protein [Erythrobacter sp.]
MIPTRDILDRIASALERIAPSDSTPVDWQSSPAYVWAENQVRAVPHLAAQSLVSLRGIEPQKHAVLSNLERFVQGHAAHDMLLWGARGMGKSALLAAATTQIQSDHPDRMALVQISPDALRSLSELLLELANENRKFLIFIDDLGFGKTETAKILELRSVLEGSVVSRPENIRLCVTSNRRAIVSRNAAEQDSPLNERDDRDDALALADRFGLSLGFHPCDRPTYLEIVRSYCEPRGVSFEEEEALAFAIGRGALSGRSARQYAVELIGRSGKAL